MCHQRDQSNAKASISLKKMVNMALVDAIMTSSVEIASLRNCFHCNARHKSSGLGDKNTTKSAIKGVKVAQMLDLGSKMVKMPHF